MATLTLAPRGRIAGVEIESHREQVPSSAHVVVPGLRKEWIQATAHFVEITQWRVGISHQPDALVYCFSRTPAMRSEFGCEDA